jgi:hypothetical protein
MTNMAVGRIEQLIVSDAQIASINSFKIQPISHFAIRNAAGATTVKIYFDGRVEIAEGVELDDAARAFWDAVRKLGARA